MATGDPRLLVVVLAGDEGGGTSRGFTRALWSQGYQLGGGLTI